MPLRIVAIPGQPDEMPGPDLADYVQALERLCTLEAELAALHAREAELQVKRLETVELPKRIEQVLEQARHVIMDWPPGPWQDTARQLVRLVQQARTDLKTGTVSRKVLSEMARLTPTMGRERVSAVLRHAKRLRQGRQIGAMNALSRTLCTLLDTRPDLATNRDIWNELERLADGEHPVIFDVKPESSPGAVDGAVSWLDRKDKLHEISQRGIYNRLARLRSPR